MSDALERLVNQKRPKVKTRTEKPDTNTSSNPDINESSIIDSNEPTHKVVRNSILLEEVVNEALTEHCRREDLIKAAWIEGAFLYLEKHPEAMQEADKLARERLQERKNAARYRQAKSFSKKLGVL